VTSMSKKERGHAGIARSRASSGRTTYYQKQTQDDDGCILVYLVLQKIGNRGPRALWEVLTSPGRNGKRSREEKTMLLSYFIPPHQGNTEPRKETPGETGVSPFGHHSSRNT